MLQHLKHVLPDLHYRVVHRTGIFLIAMGKSQGTTFEKLIAVDGAYDLLDGNLSDFLFLDFEATYGASVGIYKSVSGEEPQNLAGEGFRRPRLPDDVANL